jgi:hypothetical protein
LLLAILLFPASGILLIYKTRQLYVQHEMMMLIKNSETSFEKLLLSFSEYQKSRLNAHEIYFKGNMYDVKSVSFSNNNVELIVINDLKEKNLLKNIKDFLNKSNRQKKELPDQLQKFLSLNFLSAEKDQIIFFPALSSCIFYHRNRNNFSDFSDTPSPPPKLC